MMIGLKSRVSRSDYMSTIQELDELILKSKEKKAVFNGRIPSINKRTSRALRDEENYITTIGTWFQLEPITEIKLNDCPLDCYSWINRTLEKRNL